MSLVILKPWRKQEVRIRRKSATGGVAGIGGVPLYIWRLCSVFSVGVKLKHLGICG
jgi:hypothetical protein